MLTLDFKIISYFLDEVQVLFTIFLMKYHKKGHKKGRNVRTINILRIYNPGKKCFILFINTDTFYILLNGVHTLLIKDSLLKNKFKKYGFVLRNMLTFQTIYTYYSYQIFIFVRRWTSPYMSKRPVTPNDAVSTDTHIHRNYIIVCWNTRFYKRTRESYIIVWRDVIIGCKLNLLEYLITGILFEYWNIYITYSWSD